MNAFRFLLRVADLVLLCALAVFALKIGLPTFFSGTADDRTVVVGLCLMVAGLAVALRYEIAGCVLMLAGFGAWWGGALQEQWKWSIIPLTLLVPAAACAFALHWWLERDSHLRL